MIKSIELNDWKSFEYINLSFTSGINYITGKNGLGKSSILQAICVAFTGQTPDMIDLRSLVRRGAESAVIRVKFTKDNESYEIERHISLRARERCKVIDSKNQILFGGSWEDVSVYIENKLRIRKMPFNKIFYLSEGDVYRSIEEPPGRQLFGEIDKLLGITQLQSLKDLIFAKKNEFQTQISKGSEILRETQTRLLPEFSEDLPSLKTKLTETQLTLGKHKLDLDSLEQEMWRTKTDLQRLEVMKGDIKSIDLQENELTKLKEHNKNIEIEIGEITKDLESTISDRLAADARITNNKRVLDVLVSSQGIDLSATKCPVCAKPITTHELIEIKKELLEEQKATEQLSQNLREKAFLLDERKHNLLAENDRLRFKENQLSILKARYKDERPVIHEIENRITEAKTALVSLENKADSLRDSVEKLETLIGDSREKIGRLTAYENYKNVDNSLTLLELKNAARGDYISEFSLTAIEKLLSGQRDSRLKQKLYSDASSVWKNIKGGGFWEIKLDSESALPKAELNSQEYPFPLLSAGEKTSLLVVTRTLLGSLFTKDVDFLLLDEPLEHLDARNRHSLLQFLSDACKQGIISQMIITTTEDYLTRKFNDNNPARIMSLDSLTAIQS